MEIIKVTPRGFCKGVVGAIQIAKKARKDFPSSKITILGMLVHNRFVVDALKELDIQTVENKLLDRNELLDSIDSGIVIFTAHGISEQTYQKALGKGLLVIDATCPDVTKTQNMIKAYDAEGYTTLYIGKKGHPESEACLSVSSNVLLIETLEDINHLSSVEKMFLTNQTTMSMIDVFSIIDYAKHKFPQLIVCEEICDATRLRQEAIAKLENIDLLYIVGDPHSNNSNKLAEIGLANGVKKAILIESVEEVDLTLLKDVNRLAISSGASTPTYLTNQVIEYLEAYNVQEQIVIPTVDISKIL